MASQPSTQNDPAKQSIALDFDQMANNYDRMAAGATLKIAKHLLSIAPPITSDSVILDNAAGTGIVTREILASLPPNQPKPTIHAVDVAPAMVGFLQSRTSTDPKQWSSVTAQVMPGENLSFADNSFTHSITTFGIMFFADAKKGASEIYRTLKPGGTAIVTTWAEFSNSEILNAAESKIRPGQPHFKFPIAEEWKRLDMLEKTMREAGFEKVDLHQEESARRGKDVRSLMETFAMGLGSATKSWSESEREKLVDVLCEVVVDDRLFFIDEAAGEVGTRMVANIAVCQK